MRIFKLLCAVVIALTSVLAMPSCAQNEDESALVLRVCNWEEYIDLGGWDDEETIYLDDKQIKGESSMIEDFEKWYYSNYGVKVKVEYSTFGTNEDLYNQLVLGDQYDLVCPSEYMIMKLLAEDRLQPLSDGFFDESNENNYYINCVSPYIKEVFESNQVNGQKWSDYAAGYMWGTTGIVYNPEKVSREDASSWGILNDSEYCRTITIKDNVRDAYFPVVAMINREKLMDDEFRNAENYSQELLKIMNDTSEETVNKAEKILKDIKDNVYSFETDSGKADLVSGKVVANAQWSGDAVYTLDQAEEEGVMLEYAVPEECTNLWFDGWILLKDGIGGDAERQQVAEAFINFLSKPENAVRNMYYIGYTSAISGGEDNTVYEYVKWLYESDADDAAEYPVGYFFSADSNQDEYVIKADKDQFMRQLYAQYPPRDVIERSAIMNYFDSESNKRINQMWINVRCFSFGN